MKKGVMLLLALGAEARTHLVLPTPDAMEVYCHASCDQCECSKSRCGGVVEKNLKLLCKKTSCFDAWRHHLNTCTRICPLP